MTKTIKSNLIRLLTFIVAITCAFGILTMPSTKAWADSSSPIALEDFQMASSDVRLNVTSEDKTGLQFAAKMHADWARYDAREDSISKSYPDVAKKDIKFGIVIADEDEPTVETDGSIKISYVDKAMIEHYKPGTTESWWTGGIATYYASITYRIDKLKADFIAHDEEVKAKVAAGEISEADAKYYFSNGEYNLKEFEALMDRVYTEKLYARAYVEIPTAEGTVYIYSANTVANSVRTVATDKYFANKDKESWMAEYGNKVTKYLGVITENAAYVDSSNGKIQGKALSAYTEFSMNGETLAVGKDITFDGTTAILSSEVRADMAEGQTYTITAKDALDNYLFLNVTPVTEIITTAEQFASIFNLSTKNERCKSVGSFYSCTVTGTYILGNDIDMTGVKLDHNLVCASDAATMPASYGVGFYGTFDGCGYTISNLDLTRSCNVYQMAQTDNFRPLTKDQEGNVLSQGSSYYPSVSVHNYGHSSGRSPGLFASLGYGTTIKNVALTNVNATDSSVIALSVEGACALDANAYWEAFAGYEEATGNDYAIRAPKSTATTVCTGEAGCPVHGNDGCSATTGKKFYKCSGAAHCLYHQTTQAHDAGWCPVVLEDSSNIYIGIVADKVYLRKETRYANFNAAKAGAGITYENLYIDINESTSSFRGVFNTFGASKTDAITTMKNIIVNYNGAAATAENTGIMRGESRISTSANNYKDLDFAKTEITDLVVITKNAANLAKWKASGIALHTVVAGNKVEDGATVIAGVMQYSSIEEYAADIEAGTLSMQGFGSYWETKKTQTPVWKNEFEKVTFKVDGEVSDGTLEYTAQALGEQKTFQVDAYDYYGTKFTEFETATTTDAAVATVSKTGLITVAGSSDRSEATAIITLEANGKTFTATITLQGGFTVIDNVEVTYSADQGRFNFNGFAAEGVTFTNDTIVEATVMYNSETTNLTKQVIQVKDYGTYSGVGNVGGSGYDSNGESDDTTVNFNAFMGDVVKFAVNGEYGNYTPVLYTQQLLVKVNVGTEEEPVYKTYLFNNLKAYTAIISNIDQLNTCLQLDTAGEINKGYYILANNIIATRGIYKIKHEYAAISGGAGFQGVFDGQGYYIAGLSNRTSTSKRGNSTVVVGGLFGKIISKQEMPTVIKNLSLTKYADTCYVGFADSILSDSYETITASDDTTIKNSKYPALFENIHYKPKCSNVHGLFYAASNTVNYKFKNVVINFDNLRQHQTYNNSNYFDNNAFGMVLNTPEYGYSDPTAHVETFAKAAYYTNAFENVVLVANLPVVGVIRNKVASQGYSAKEPLDTYYMGYGWNKIGQSGMKIARIAQANAANSPSNLSNLVFNVLSSQQTLANVQETPWKSVAVNGAEYTITDPADSTASKTYTTAHEQAFFFKGIYQYYGINELGAAIKLAEGGATDAESLMINAFVADGMPFKFSAEYTRESVKGRTIEWAQGNNG